jgi:hypothetical protein
MGPRIYIPQEQGSSDIPPGTGFPFRRLLRLAGLRWRYSIPPTHGKMFFANILTIHVLLSDFLISQQSTKTKVSTAIVTVNQKYSARVQRIRVW